MAFSYLTKNPNMKSLYDIQPKGQKGKRTDSRGSQSEIRVVIHTPAPSNSEANKWEPARGSWIEFSLRGPDDDSTAGCWSRVNQRGQRLRTINHKSRCFKDLFQQIFSVLLHLLAFSPQNKINKQLILTVPWNIRYSIGWTVMAKVDRDHFWFTLC